MVECRRSVSSRPESDGDLVSSRNGCVWCLFPSSDGFGVVRAPGCAAIGPLFAGVRPAKRKGVEVLGSWVCHPDPNPNAVRRTLTLGVVAAASVGTL